MPKREKSAELDPKSRRFPAAPVAKSVDVTEAGTVEIVLILDLGFRIYHEARVSLFGVTIPRTTPNGVAMAEHHELVRRFVTHWAKNGDPFLDVVVYGIRPDCSCAVADVRRQELEPETFKPLGYKSLGEALVEQGLVEWIS